MSTITQRFLKGIGHADFLDCAKPKVRRRMQNRPGYLTPFRERHAAKVAAARRRRLEMLARMEAAAKNRTAAQ